jgi:hypothetical protein
MGGPTYSELDRVRRALAQVVDLLAEIARRG